MTENAKKQSTNGRPKDETATVIAGLSGLSDRHVRRVINGDSENEQVLTAAILYKEGKNRLIEEIKKLVPFN